MQIPIIIPIHEDELLYSWIIRLAIANGFGNIETSALRAFSGTYIHVDRGSSTTPPNHNCSNNIFGLFASLTPIQNQFVDLFIKHTGYCVYRHFLNDSKQLTYVNSALYPHDIGYKSLLLFNRTEGMTAGAFICPECAKEDIENYGYFYLHTNHHLPGVKCCIKHRVPLRKYTGMQTRELENINDYSESFNVCEHDYKYAQFTTVLAQQDDLRIRENICSVVIDQIHELGLSNIYKDETQKYFLQFPTGLNNKQIKRTMHQLVSKSKSLNFESILQILTILFDNFDTVYKLIKEKQPTPIKSELFDEIIENDYSIIGSPNQSLVFLQNNQTKETFFTTPFGFHLGWREYTIQSQISEQDMMRKLVKKISNGTYEILPGSFEPGKPVGIKHLLCGEIGKWKVTYFLHNSTKCTCEYVYTDYSAREKLKQVVGDRYKLLSFTKFAEHATFKCQKCGNIFEKKFYNMLRNPCCEHCAEIERQERIKRQQEEAENNEIFRSDPIAGTKIKAETEVYQDKKGRVKVRINRNHHKEYFEEQIKALVGDEYTLVGEYKNVRTKVKLRHNTCGNVFEMTPASFINGHRCVCRGHILEEDFKQYVKDASYGRYIVLNLCYNAGAYSHILLDTQTNKQLTMKKVRILQELSRPTPSPILPCNRPKVVSPYKMTPWMQLYLYLKQNFDEKDIFTASEINCEEVGLSYESVTNELTALKRRNLIYPQFYNCYCMSDYKHTPLETAYYRYCSRKGKRIGYFSYSTLINEICGCESSKNIHVRSNLVNNEKYHPIKVKDTEFYVAKTRAVCDDKNCEILMALEIVANNSYLFQNNENKIVDWLSEREFVRPVLIALASQYEVYTRFTMANINKLFHCNPYGEDDKPQPKKYTRQEVYDLIKSIYGVERPIIPGSMPFEGLSTRALTSHLNRLEQDGKLKRLAKSIYVLSDSSMSLEEAYKSKYLYDAFGNPIGYFGGEWFQYFIGLKEEIPNEPYIVSNLRIDSSNTKAIRVHTGNYSMLVKLPVCKVNSLNYKILPALDLLKKYPDFTDHVLDYVKAYFEENDITYEQCMLYMQYYTNAVLRRINRIFGIEGCQLIDYDVTPKSMS